MQTQRNLSLLEYFNKMQALWDEYDCLTSGKTLEELKEIDRLMQYLVELGEGYQHARHQILLIDPLPSVEKAYSMLLNVESEMAIQLAATTGMDSSAFFAKQFVADKKITEKFKAEDKSKLVCEHCKRRGHNKQMCFELNGFPDWYKDLQQRRQAIDKGKVILGAPRSNGMAASVSETVRSELSKFFGNKELKEQQGTEDPFTVNCAYEFASNINCLSSSFQITLPSPDSWIIDSGLPVTCARQKVSSKTCDSLFIIKQSRFRMAIFNLLKKLVPWN